MSYYVIEPEKNSNAEFFWWQVTETTFQEGQRKAEGKGVSKERRKDQEYGKGRFGKGLKGGK